MAPRTSFQTQPKVAAAPQADEPSLPIACPARLTAAVIVQTKDAICGQHEHSAMITRVHSDDVVNVMVFPGSGQPFPIDSISRHPAGALSWRYPPKR